MGAIVARQDNFHKTSQMGRLPFFNDDGKLLIISAAGR
ncbi:porin [Escherichia coli O121:H19 str. 2011C-3609]|nr:hypothetical protein EC50959_0945 [Escherichia coli 5.0959]KDV56191.1 porin [Escherichia coli O121:H19 str. 2011C-3609]